ncbi:MAG: thiamine pyrophosphate-requiring protein [Rhodothalassiaceae bacterium]
MLHVPGTERLSVETAAEALLALLRRRGIEYLFANAGTDFPAIIEAYARQPQSGLALPRALAVPHENAAIAMAHGHWLGSGRMQAAMVHVSVGIANALCGLLNAARENVPLFFMAGRTPITEDGDIASRDVSIHWGQEMFDQAAMLREAVRFDYELRTVSQLVTLIDRAMALGNGDPAGPVYIGLPREVLGETISGLDIPARSRISPVRLRGADPALIEETAQLIAAAERPLIITSRAGRDPAAVAALAAFAERTAIAVVEYRANYMNLPDDHPMHAGFDLGPDFAAHDLVLVLDCIAPWLPARHMAPAAPVVMIGPDPLAADIPIRGFPADIALACHVAPALAALSQALEPWLTDHADAIAARRARLEAVHRERRVAMRARLLPPAKDGRLTPAYASTRIAAAIGPEALIVNEIGCVRPLMERSRPGSFFGPSNAGGLGWGLPASLGLKLARPEALVVATIGDGSMMFANPVACHQVAAAENIATLSIVFNNRRWNAVKTATASVYPDGHAMRANRVPLTALDPSPAFERIIAACGGHGEAVHEAAALDAALARAIHEVRAGRPALLNLLVEE